MKEVLEFWVSFTRLYFYFIEFYPISRRRLCSVTNSVRVGVSFVDFCFHRMQTSYLTLLPPPHTRTLPRFCLCFRRWRSTGHQLLVLLQRLTHPVSRTIAFCALPTSFECCKFNATVPHPTPHHPLPSLLALYALLSVSAPPPPRCRQKMAVLIDPVVYGAGRSWYRENSTHDRLCLLANTASNFNRSFCFSVHDRARRASCMKLVADTKAWNKETVMFMVLSIFVTFISRNQRLFCLLDY